MDHPINFKTAEELDGPIYEVTRKVSSLREALELFRSMLDVRKVMDIKLKGARVGSQFIRNGSDDKFLVLYKREKYLHFGRHFPHVKEKGYGNIANIKLVHWAAMEGVSIVTIFPDGRAYWLDGMEFWLYYEENKTDVKHAPGEIATPLSKWKRLF